MPPDIDIVTDLNRIDPLVVHRFLADTYWACDRTLAQTAICLANSTPFAVFDGAVQIGFGRVISDRITLAYMLDVYVDPKYRGLGIGTHLTKTILSYPRFYAVSRWMLRTSNAQTLYSRFGFALVAAGDTLMVLDRTPRNHDGDSTMPDTSAKTANDT